MNLLRKLIFANCLLLPLQALGAGLTVLDGWIRETPPGAQNAAAFLTLRNDSSETLTLTGVDCPATVASRCEIHEHIHHEGRMRMQAVASLDIAPGATLPFKPGGYHVMLLGLAQPLKRGQSIELVFVTRDQLKHAVALSVKPVSEE